MSSSREVCREEYSSSRGVYSSSREVCREEYSSSRGEYSSSREVGWTREEYSSNSNPGS